MKHTLHRLLSTVQRIALIALVAVPLTGCYKDALETPPLNNNPFDPEYEGPAVFELVGTYLQTVDIGGNQVIYQVIEFRVREDLFLSPATYSVLVKDLTAGTDPVERLPEPPGSNTFKYYRQPAPGQSICLELRLYNNLHAAGAETLCATL